jgi:hypothetical protein
VPRGRRARRHGKIGREAKKRMRRNPISETWAEDNGRRRRA